MDKSTVLVPHAIGPTRQMPGVWGPSPQKITPKPSHVPIRFNACTLLRFHSASRRTRVTFFPLACFVRPRHNTLRDTPLMNLWRTVGARSGLHGCGEIEISAGVGERKRRADERWVWRPRNSDG